MDISRRGFVKATAVALASAAAAGTMSSLVGCASGEGQSTTAASGDGQKYTSVCRFCGCGCGVICEVKDNKLISVTGDPDNESNKGLNCVKGYYLAKIMYGDDRLTTPMIREDKSTKAPAKVCARRAGTKLSTSCPPSSKRRGRATSRAWPSG